MPTRFHLLMPLLLFALACSPRVEPPPVPDFAFDDRPPIGVAVASVDIINEYKPPLKAPNVEHEFRAVPTQVARSWARARLEKGGPQGSFVFRIEDASVIEKELPTQTGLKDFIYKEQSRELIATLDVDLEYDVPWNQEVRTGKISVSAESTTTLLEGMTLAEIDTAYFKMLEALGEQLDTQMQARLREVFAP